MKRYIVILLFLIPLTVSIAQETLSLYFDKNWKLTTQDLATYTREVRINPDDFSFQGDFSDTNKNGNKITTGQYVNGKKQGAFIFNYEDGTLNRNGLYQDDQPVGVWNFYFTNSQLRFKIEFLNDDFKILEFYDENGNSKMSGSNIVWEYIYTNGTGIKGILSDGVKNGKWQLIENNRIIGYEVYKNGKYKKTFESLFKKFTKTKLISNLVFTPLYLTYSEGLEASANIDKNDYPYLKNLQVIASLPSYEDLGGVGLLEDAIITDLENGLLFMGGMARIQQILSRNIRPAKELDGISGRVFIDLYIDKDGDPYQVEIVRSDNELMNAEVLRLAQLFTEWKPAKYKGEAITSKVTLPLNLSFKLHKQN